MSGIETHYSASNLETRILAALKAAGLDPDKRQDPTVLAALDHFHTGGFRTSRLLRTLARIQANERILDIGAGLAGPARMLASLPGCDVECIDLSADYCKAAALLNRLTGLEHHIGIHIGSALDIPFDAKSFDVVWMQNVGMNIANKQQLYKEIYRVLKPGGRFAFQEMLAGKTECSRYPLPWASEPGENALISAGQLDSLLLGCGFEKVHFADESDEPLPPPSTGTPEGQEPAPLSLSVYVDDLALKADNATYSLQQGEIRLYRGVFRVNPAT